MELYLMRHGIAEAQVGSQTDAERKLTKEGRQKTEKVAQQLVAGDLRFDLILASPLVRAYQTAEILIAAGLSSELEQSDLLTNTGNIHKWLTDWLEPRQYSHKTKLALVGHEPNLSNWAEILVWGASKGCIVLKKAGMIGIKLPEVGSPLGQSQMFLLIPPRYLS
jgi:phosphohistidine phosphatase